MTAGAFLLDAETRLNPAAAAAYFGAGNRPGAATPTTSLSPEEQRLAELQKICPVTGEPLDSMGGPVRVLVDGRIVFVCCEGCTPTLKADPARYLKKLPKP